MRDERDGADSTGAVSPADPADEPVTVEDLVADLDGVGDAVDSSAARAHLGRTKQLLQLASARGIIDSRVRRLDARDAAEALVGSVVFASPLLVEDGIVDIADHLLLDRAAGVPVYLLANVAFVVVMTYALVEWTGRDRTDSHRLLGVVPGRVLMVLGVSLLATAVLMTIWGRLGDWQSPVDALARISVLWTVAAIGGALGDLVAEGDPEAAASIDGDDGGDEGDVGDLPDVEDVPAGDIVTDLDEEFDGLAAAVDDAQTRSELRQIEARANRAVADDLFGERIDVYTPRDLAEAFVGSVVFAIPLLVEDGVFDVAAYFRSLAVGGFPVFFLANAAFVLVMIAAILYWTGPQDVRVTRPIFGIVPRRMVGIAVVSALTAAALLTLWGRLEGWTDPVDAVARVTVVWTVAAFGGALGDVLPGESSGADINDQLADLGERVVESVEDLD